MQKCNFDGIESVPAFLSHLNEFRLENLDARTIEILRQDAESWIRKYNAFSDAFPDQDVQQWLQENFLTTFQKTCEFVEVLTCGT